MKQQQWLKIISILWLSVAASFAVAETPEEKGFAIAKEADARNKGFVDNEATMVMILKDKRGNSSERQMRVKTLEGTGGEGDKSLMVFDTPKDQKGTALLTFQHDDKDDDQWLYLPALKRVKKIASKNKSGPFMGSEFSFEDLSGQQIEKYTYKWIKDEKIKDDKGVEHDCFVLEAYPKDENSGYTKVVNWVDKEHYRTYKAEFWDRKNSHLKTLTPEGFKQYEGKFWRSDKIEMVNLQTGKSTIMINSELKFNAGLDAADFNKNSLKRAR